MRYVVTGAAGFIGSQLLRTLLERGHDAVGWDAFTDYYDPALKEENARGLPVERIDLAEDTLDLDGVDGVFHLAGQPGVLSFGGVFPVYVRQNVLASRASLRRRRGRGSAHGASPRPRRSTATRRATPPTRTLLRGRSRRTGSRSSPASTSAYAYGEEFGLEHVVVRYFTIFGPRQRPDMALTRMIEVSRRGTAVRALRRRHAVAELHVRRRCGRGDDPRDGARARPDRSSTSAAARRSRCAQAIETLAAVAGSSSSSCEARRREGDARRTLADTSRIRAETGWEPRTPFAEGLASSVALGR